MRAGACARTRSSDEDHREVGGRRERQERMAVRAPIRVGRGRNPRQQCAVDWAAVDEEVQHVRRRAMAMQRPLGSAQLSSAQLSLG
jgi:hypothetical protein